MNGHVVPNKEIQMQNKRMVVALFLIYFVFAILLNSVGIVILQVINNFGISKAGASILEGFKDVPIAIVSFLAVAVLPRIGYKNSMLIALGIMTFACVAMPLVPSFLTIKLLFMCAGMTFALVKVSVYSSIGLLTKTERDHGQFMNMLEGFFMVGVLSGYWLFSSFIDSSNPESRNWLKIYWLLGGVCAITFLLLLSADLDESEAKPQHATEAPGIRLMYRLLAAPTVCLFLMSAAFYVVVEQSIGSWLPTFNNEIMKLPLSMSVQVASIWAASIAIGRVAFSALLRKLSWYPLLNACVIGIIILIVLTMPLTREIQANANTTWANAPLAAYIFPLIGLFMAPIYPAINSVMLSSMPVHQHSTITGLVVIFSATGGTVGSFITGTVFNHFNGQTAFYLTLVPLMVIMISLFFFKRALENARAVRRTTFTGEHDLETAIR